MPAIKKHTIQDNVLQINNQEYHALDMSKIIVGIENENETEIVRDEETGLNYSRNKVESQEIYNYSTKRHRNWFILDLETGSRGWYPGCVIYGQVLSNNVPVLQTPEEDSIVLTEVSYALVQILDTGVVEQPKATGWYNILYSNIEGYIDAKYVSNITYRNPLN